MMEELNLTSVKDSLIGDKLKRGISGGERKRVSIGKELCYEPKLLLLDEPTSGLDSFTSVKVMKLLRQLAERGRTLACTIHQPSSEIFSRFDQLMLLVSGRVVYYGAASTALSYFQNLGFHCPQYANPADFFLSLCDESDEPSAEDPTGPTPREIVGRLVGTYAASEVKRDALVRIEVVKRAALSTSITRRGVAEQQTYLPSPSCSSSSEQQQVDGEEEEVKPKRRRRSRKDMKGEEGSSNTLITTTTIASVSWARQFSVLCRRSLLNSCRNPLSSYVIMGRTVIMALLVGSLYWQLDLSTEGIMNRQGAIFFLIMNQVFSSLGSLHLLLDEQEIVSHEARSAMYPISAYYMAKQFAELPVLLITTIIFAVVTYWMVGFQNHLSNFLTYIAAVVLTGVVGESYILVCGSVTTSSKVAIVIAPVFMALFMLFGGFFVNAGSVPAYYAWIKYISLFNYLNGAMQKNEFQGLTFEGGLTGDQVIDSLHLMSLSVWGNLGVICGMITVFRILAFMFVNKNFTPPPFRLPPQDVVDLVELNVEEEKSISYQSTRE